MKYREWMLQKVPYPARVRSLSQRRKNLGSRVALLPAKFLLSLKVFARITEKPAKLSQSCEDRPDRLRSVRTA